MGTTIGSGCCLLWSIRMDEVNWPNLWKCVSKEVRRFEEEPCKKCHKYLHPVLQWKGTKTLIQNYIKDNHPELKIDWYRVWKLFDNWFNKNQKFCTSCGREEGVPTYLEIRREIKKLIKKYKLKPKKPFVVKKSFHVYKNNK